MTAFINMYGYGLACIESAP
jgi:hypothetical protein